MIEDLTLFNMAKKTLGWLSRRQDVIAQNVANANTPGYQSRDLKPLDFKQTLSEAGGVQLVTTDPAHIQAPAEEISLDAEVERRPQESKPDGNTVLLEEQMEKIGDVKSNYETALNIIQKNIKMLQIAIKGSTS